MIGGIDESGRGSLFGPVCIAGVIFKDSAVNQEFYNKLNDSKKLSKNKRKMLVDSIKKHSYYHIVSIDNTTIDRINILQATYSGMNECIHHLKIYSNTFLIDGNRFTIGDENRDVNYECIIKGDSKVKEIMAASILAKEHHDSEIVDIINDDPSIDVYSLVSNMGYGTKSHIEGIKNNGISRYHRKSFCKKFLIS